MDSWMTIFVPANRCEQSRRRELQKQPKSRGGVKPRRSSCRIYALNRPAGRNHARCEPSWTLLRAAGNNTGLYQEKTGEHLSRRDVQRASGGFQHLSMDAETSSWRTQMCLREGGLDLRKACYHLQLCCHGSGETGGGISVSVQVESSREDGAAPGLQLGDRAQGSHISRLCCPVCLG
uniref:uncharacterized protein LOC118551966 isoform X6 n=1 Tax=Halichoerus grypus TaxID=9711 RepID=UPI0016598548|nr:uncharacterized protein LOC118551966 isoform X6 [Halichoerus grypus]